MSDLFIEFRSEEIPARMQKAAEKQAFDLYSKILYDHSCAFTSLHAWASPRRLTLKVTGLPLQIPDRFLKKRGPRLDAPKQALDGFLRSVGCNSTNDLIQEEKYWIFEERLPGQEISDLVPQWVMAFLEKFSWPKSLRWTNSQTGQLTPPWVRPLRGIGCLLNKKPLIFSIPAFGLVSDGFSVGHSFLSPTFFPLSETYEDDLEIRLVIPDYTKRRQRLEEELSKYPISQDNDLLDEVTGLVEWPFIALGNIDSEFMSLPPEVLKTSMRVHQKYFSLCDDAGNMLPQFLVVTNVPPTLDMIHNYEKVLRARLRDAAFFYANDLKISLEDRVPDLDRVIFHERLGNMGQKVKRLVSLVSKDTQHAALLCKSDLLTQMVGEFPELQGHMGYLYAGKEAYAKVLRDYYSPLNPEDSIPENPLARELSLVDKMDALVGFLGIGIIPSGSKDPYALRRTALGILRILMESKEPLNTLIQKSIDAYAMQGIKLSATVFCDVFVFFMERLRFWLKGQGMAPEVIRWGIPEKHSFKEFQVSSCIEKCHVFSQCSAQSLTSLWRRLRGFPEPSIRNFTEASPLQNALDSLVWPDGIREKFQALFGIAPFAESFLDTLTILDKDEDVRNRRLYTLAKVKDLFKDLGDWDTL